MDWIEIVINVTPPLISLMSVWTSWMILKHTLEPNVYMRFNGVGTYLELEWGNYSSNQALDLEIKCDTIKPFLPESSRNILELQDSLMPNQSFKNILDPPYVDIVSKETKFKFDISYKSKIGVKYKRTIELNLNQLRNEFFTSKDPMDTVVIKLDAINKSLKNLSKQKGVDRLVTRIYNRIRR